LVSPARSLTSKIRAKAGRRASWPPSNTSMSPDREASIRDRNDIVSCGSLGSLVDPAPSDNILRGASGSGSFDMARELHRSHGLGHGTQHHCGIIRMMALLALACATAGGVSEAAAGWTQHNVDPTVMRRAVSWLRPTTRPARGAGLPHAASGSRSGGSSLRMNPARFTAIHQATTYLAHTGSCTGPIPSGEAHLSYRSTISDAGRHATLASRFSQELRKVSIDDRRLRPLLQQYNAASDRLVRAATKLRLTCQSSATTRTAI
jgi:hypothetical protein